MIVPSPTQLALHVGLHDTATLDNFYAAGNAMAVAQVQHMAAGTGESCLYLWGASGTGCTHLLQAACQRAEQLQQTACYLPLTELLAKGTEVFDGVDALDLVCIDNLGVIAGDAIWEEALFHLYNRLRDQGKGLLLAADRPPRQLDIDLPDLASRLNWGMVMQLHPLDDDARVAALRLRARGRGIELTDEVLQYLQHRGPRQTGALFALLDTLDQASLSAKRRVTIPFIKETLGW